MAIQVEFIAFDMATEIGMVEDEVGSWVACTR
jgi:hypothetical protein